MHSAAHLSHKVMMIVLLLTVGLMRIPFAQPADQNKPAATYDPTNYGTAPQDWKGAEPPMVLSPLSKAVATIWDIQPTMPDSIIFHVHTSPERLQFNEQPTSWTYTITDKSKIEEIVEAMKSVRQIWFGAGSTRPHHEKVYTITYRYSGTNPDIRTTVKEITFDLTHEIEGLYNYEKLIEALKDYSPGFKPQDYYMYRIPQ